MKNLQFPELFDETDLSQDYFRRRETNEIKEFAKAAYKDAESFSRRISSQIISSGKKMEFEPKTTNGISKLAAWMYLFLPASSQGEKDKKES